LLVCVTLFVLVHRRMFYSNVRQINHR